jgi:hypothetical protein
VKVPLLVLTLLTVGCSDAECGGSFEIDSGFTDVEEDGIHEAVDFFNAWAGKPTFRLESGGMCHIKIEDCPGAMGACYQTLYGDIWIDREQLKEVGPPGSVNDQGWRNIVMHELGHSVGMGHVDGLDSVMSAKTVRQGGFSDEDRAECVRASVCSS